MGVGREGWIRGRGGNRNVSQCMQTESEVSEFVRLDEEKANSPEKLRDPGKPTRNAKDPSPRRLTRPTQRKPHGR